MDAFLYQNNELFAEQVALKQIAQTYGTPTYVYSRRHLEERFLSYQNALQGREHLICYAVKANSNIGVLNVLARLGSGFDIVSIGELERVLAAGGEASKVVYSGVAKTKADIAHALKAGIHCFNVESEGELEAINQVAAELDMQARISLRLNPDVDAKTHPYISTGLKDNKFGIDIERAPAVYQRANSLSHIEVIGVDCHIGSQLTEISPFLDALDRLLSLIDSLAEQGIVIKHLDLGGGLGVRYQDETPPEPGEYVAAVLERLGERELTLAFEPGRSIAANAGVLLTKVEYLKCNPHKNFAIIDAAMNDMIRPALYQAWLNIQPVTPRAEGVSKRYDIVGPVCETGDFLGKDRELILEQGDLLSVAGAGAYGFTMSSNYNSRGRAAEIMVDGDSCHVIRARETIADLMLGEALLPE
ncbi:diaminopimelate decarboxylase [Dasania sp. GY-MA-18]|uniref:Diaminopimelate decarboxylase n=1 Tax=Dasania phycosphaerae TaxID=2950436 RepID=A0A9J6RKC3_9GAMM|nr:MULTISPECIES: diaminopimelate decarboxylase [Dasania]MCR8922511.1 diaminopimelate decarboxylase [Dasania sp. GY-MA-18]MCZ0864939.1 diaminopimelate decarboxylase [Dasania phycosphaerae]MCZ0868667.1 diaminopimelate decarboxylase [Dasania phycosphaerae]